MGAARAQCVHVQTTMRAAVQTTRVQTTRVQTNRVQTNRVRPRAARARSPAVYIAGVVNLAPSADFRVWSAERASANGIARTDERGSGASVRGASRSRLGEWAYMIAWRRARSIAAQ
eukprot:6069112-Prymnesium_polylepis.1